MRGVIYQIFAALDDAKQIRLREILFDGAVVRFITSEDGGIPAVRQNVDTVSEWFGKHGLDEGQGD